MTAGELIEILRQFPPSVRVVLPAETRGGTDIQTVALGAIEAEGWKRRSRAVGFGIGEHRFVKPGSGEPAIYLSTGQRFDDDEPAYE
jgi:hypothetical protein